MNDLGIHNFWNAQVEIPYRWLYFSETGHMVISETKPFQNISKWLSTSNSGIYFKSNRLPAWQMAKQDEGNQLVTRIRATIRL